MIRRALSIVGVELLLAVAMGWAVLALGRLGTGRFVGAAVNVLTALGVVALLLALPVVALLDRERLLVVNGVPGLRSTQPRPSIRLLRVGAGAVVCLVLTSTGLGLTPLALAMVAVVDVGLAVIVIRLLAELRRRAHRRSALTAALTAFQPRFVVYTARRNDASYQLAMWLPQLEKLDLPYLVVVRHPEAIPHARLLTRAPIVCCPASADLDALLVPSLTAAFYVNGVSENTNFVQYRQLRHVYLGHGDSDKEMSVHPMHAMYDRIFVAGQAAVDRYADAGVRIEPDKFVIVGRPQLAGLRCRTGSARVDSDRAGSDRAGSDRAASDRAASDRAASDRAASDRAASDRGRARPARVLVAPTWRGYNAVSAVSSLPVATGIVAALIAAGAEITFRPHPFSWLGGEQHQIEEVDALLRADRDTSGRAHRLATENRGSALGWNFDDSDALVTDIGSVLVDYFATEKPYAVVLPDGIAPEQARSSYPSTRAAYLVSADQVASGPAAGWVEDLLVTDPKADERPAVCQRYLGERPRDDRPFVVAAAAVVDDPRAAERAPGLPASPQDADSHRCSGQEESGEGKDFQRPEPPLAGADDSAGGVTGSVPVGRPEIAGL